MQPREITPGDRELWAELHPREFTFAAPEQVSPDAVLPCQALVTDDADGISHQVIRVPWQPDDNDIARIAAGGTIWLSSHSMLPVHSIAVA